MVACKFSFLDELFEGSVVQGSEPNRYHFRADAQDGKINADAVMGMYRRTKGKLSISTPASFKFTASGREDIECEITPIRIDGGLVDLTGQNKPGNLEVEFITMAKLCDLQAAPSNAQEFYVNEEDDAINQEIADDSETTDALGLKVSQWSAGAIDLDIVPFPAATKLHYAVPPHMSEPNAPYKYEPGIELCITLPVNATWRNIAQAADKAIFYSGCPDHHFIESIDDCGEFVRLHTGS